MSLNIRITYLEYRKLPTTTLSKHKIILHGKTLKYIVSQTLSMSNMQKNAVTYHTTHCIDIWIGYCNLFW